jgi:hypothetical protein
VGGYGFAPLNALRAGLQAYFTGPSFTLLAVYSPVNNGSVSTSVDVRWTVFGAPCQHYQILIDGSVLVADFNSTLPSYLLDISHLAPGPHMLTLIALDALTPFPLAVDKFDAPLAQPVHPTSSVAFVVQPPLNGSGTLVSKPGGWLAPGTSPGVNGVGGGGMGVGNGGWGGPVQVSYLPLKDWNGNGYGCMGCRGVVGQCSRGDAW